MISLIKLEYAGVTAKAEFASTEGGTEKHYTAEIDGEHYSICDDAGHRTECYDRFSETVYSPFFSVFRMLHSVQFSTLEIGRENMVYTVRDLQVNYSCEDGVHTLAGRYTEGGETYVAVAVKNLSGSFPTYLYCVYDGADRIIDSAEYLGENPDSRYYPLYVLLNDRLEREMSGK